MSNTNDSNKGTFNKNDFAGADTLSNFIPGVEAKILRYIEAGLTVREAVFKSKPPGYVRDQLVEKYERLFR